MDIVLNEEQVLLRESVGKFLADRYDFASRQAIVRTEEGLDKAIWRDFAEMGLLAAPLGEDVGGLGQGPLSTMVLAQEFGRHLVVEPFFETVVVAAGLIERDGTSEQQARYLPDIVAGTSMWALAATEAGSRYDFGRITTTATPQGSGFLLRGAKAAVMAAPWAHWLLVSARIASSNSIGLFIVDRRAADLHVQDFRTIDGRRAAEITLDGVMVPHDALLGAKQDALPALERCRTYAIAAQCADAVGAMEELVRITVDYAKTRKQFGVAIGSFQVLQHRMVDMFIALQEATAMTNLLTATLSTDGGLHDRLASATKAKVGEAARYVGEQAVQIHGGMGMSDELNVGHYLKRLTAMNIQFGDPAWHFARYGAARQAA